MKVYLVTSGAYSDYEVEKIFLSRPKAEAYVAHRGELGFLVGIEERETSDEEVLPEFVTWYVAETAITAQIDYLDTRTYTLERYLTSYKKETGDTLEDRHARDLDSFRNKVLNAVRIDIARSRPTERLFILGYSTESPEVAEKIMQDRIPEVIQFLEEHGFKPKEREFNHGRLSL